MGARHDLGRPRQESARDRRHERDRSRGCAQPGETRCQGGAGRARSREDGPLPRGRPCQRAWRGSVVAALRLLPAEGGAALRGRGAPELRSPRGPGEQRRHPVQDPHPDRGRDRGHLRRKPPRLLPSHPAPARADHPERSGAHRERRFHRPSPGDDGLRRSLLRARLFPEEGVRPLQAGQRAVHATARAEARRHLRERELPPSRDRRSSPSCGGSRSSPPKKAAGGSCSSRRAQSCPAPPASISRTAGSSIRRRSPGTMASRDGSGRRANGSPG